MSPLVPSLWCFCWTWRMIFSSFPMGTGRWQLHTALLCKLMYLRAKTWLLHVPPVSRGKSEICRPLQAPALACDSCPAVRATPAAHGKCHFPKKEPITFTTSKLNKWFPDSWSNLSVTSIYVSVQKLWTGQPSFILKAAGIWDGKIACFFKKIIFNIKMLARLAILIKN